MVASVQTIPQMNLPLSCGAGVAYARAMDPAPEDSALMLRYKDGDIAAFETLYRRHNDPLYRYLLRLCRHPDNADDIFQEVWGKIIKAADRYRPTAKFTTFLYKVAHNCFIDHIRRNKRHTHPGNIEPENQARSRVISRISWPSEASLENAWKSHCRTCPTNNAMYSSCTRRPD